MKNILLLFFFAFFPFHHTFAVHQTYQSPTCIRPTGSGTVPLDNATVSAVFKDRLGLMWFFSDYGLYSYDGTTYRSFRAPVFGLDVVQIEETPEGLFFLFCSDGSLYCFDRDNEQFITPTWNASPLPHGTKPQLTYSRSSGLISADDKGLLRVAYRVDRSEQTARLVLTPFRIVSFDRPLEQAKADPSGRIYAVVKGTHDIVRFDLRANTAQYFDIYIPLSSATEKQIARLFVFNDEFWYSFYWSGLFYCNTRTRESIVFDANDDEKDKGQINYVEVRAMAQDAKGNFYMASWNGCLHISKPTLGTEPYITRSPYNIDIWGQAIEQRALSIYCDQAEETLWVGTLGGGVVRYSNDMSYTIPLPKKSIYQLTEDRRGYVWLSTAQSGILRSNSTTIDERTTFAPWGVGLLSSDRQTLYNDKRRSLWIADNRGNIVQVDQTTEQPRAFFLSTDGKTRIREGISAMCLDAQGRFWVASYLHLYYWDTKRDQTPIFKRLILAGIPAGVPLMHLIEDREGLLWVGTQHGLFQLQESGDTFHVTGGYEHMVGSNPSMVYALKTNRQGDILASYGDRLTRIDNNDKDRVDWEVHVADETLPSSHILSIVNDRYGNTWLGTNTCIMVVKSGGHYLSIYSLSNSNLDGCQLEDGRLLWASANGLTYFNPTEIRDEWTNYSLELSRLTVNGADVYAGVPLGGEVILRQGLSQTDTLILSERQSNFDLCFSDLSYTSFKKRVLYKLSPLMDDWKPHVMGENLSFPQLSPGVYRLLIKPLYANEKEGLVKSLTIIIRPVWYRSIGFVVLSFVVSLGVLWFVFLFGLKSWHRFRRRSIHRVYEAIQMKHDVLSPVPVASEGKILVLGPKGPETEHIAAIFSDSAFEVFFSYNSADGLIDLLYHLPRVVLCCLDMPDALEFCRRAKQNVRSSMIPLVVVDELDDPDHRLAVVEARADDYVVLGAEGENDALLRQVVENRMSGREAMNLILSRMIEEQKQPETGDTDNTAAGVLIRQIEALVLEHAKDSTFGVRRLAELMHVSQSTLYRRVLKAADGRTVIEVMRDVRLRRAAELLTEGNLTISAIAEEVGYQDVATFRKHFSDLFGLNPSGFIKMQEGGSSAE